VGELEVLVGELLAVDGLSTSALLGKCVSAPLSTAGVCVCGFLLRCHG
jgi:hypothetical protein